MSRDLSSQSKQSIQIASLVATILVVGIHYKSDIPNTPILGAASWNELLQEFWFGGVARVAVPLFALFAGLLYFRSYEGTWANYRDKWLTRCRSVLFPYFIVASVATVCWLLIQRIQNDGHDLNANGLLVRWLLRPPAEQLWFLRDLMVLVTIAPLLAWMTRTRTRTIVSLALLAAAWLSGYQPFPIVGGWYALNLDTLLFFTFGAVLSSRFDLLNRIASMSHASVACWCVVWLSLVALRVVLRPDFDIWYIRQCGWPDLLAHQISILVGCGALFAFATRLDSARLRRWSSVSFFVFLVHEFPLRAVIDTVIERSGDWPESCWFTFALVTVGCYAGGLWCSLSLPRLFELLTGGRTPGRAAAIAEKNRTTPSAVPSNRREIP